MEDAKKLELKEMLERAEDDLLELLEVASKIPADKRKMRVLMAMEVLMGENDGLDTVVRYWPKLSHYWHENILEDVKEGIRDGQRERELARKYKSKG